MWNNLDLKCPSDDMVEYQSQEKFQAEKLSDFATILLEAGSTLASDDPLWNEMHVLQNIQAKYRRLLRCDKCLIYLHRVSHCVKKMVLLNLSLNYRELAERLLIGLRDSSDNLHLPSQQQVEYIMIRTQSAAKLVTEAVKYSQDTFCFLVQKLKVGHHILDLHMATAVTARINVMLKGILIQLYDIYQKVLEWHHEFKEGEYKWSGKLNLPENLETWITTFESNLTRPHPNSKLDEKLLASDFKAQDGSTGNDSDSVIVVDSESETDCLVMDEAEDSDSGEVIQRHNIGLLPLQWKLLTKIILSGSVEKLEKVWKMHGELSQGCFPARLSTKKVKIISKFLRRAKVRNAKMAHLLKENPKKEYRASVPVVSVMLAKYLGFTHDQILSCRGILKKKQRYPINFGTSQSADMLQPVKTLKKLRLQYKYLCQMFLSANNLKEHEKLKKKFKRKIDDIKLLQQSGEKPSARDLTFCTSKIILTLYKKSLKF